MDRRARVAPAPLSGHSPKVRNGQLAKMHLMFATRQFVPNQTRIVKLEMPGFFFFFIIEVEF